MNLKDKSDDELMEAVQMILHQTVPYMEEIKERGIRISISGEYRAQPEVTFSKYEDITPGRVKNK